MKNLVLTSFLILFFYNYGQSQCFTVGADMSYTNSVLAKGGIYKDSNGNTIDPYILFAQKVWNYRKGFGKMPFIVWCQRKDNHKCCDKFVIN